MKCICLGFGLHFVFFFGGVGVGVGSLKTCTVQCRVFKMSVPWARKAHAQTQPNLRVSSHLPILVDGNVPYWSGFGHTSCRLFFNGVYAYNNYSKDRQTAKVGLLRRLL